MSLYISLLGPDTRAFARFVLSFRPHALDGSRTAYLSRTANECRWTRFMTPIDRYIDQKMIAWPSVAVGRREAGDVRISFFLACAITTPNMK